MVLTANPTAPTHFVVPPPRPPPSWPVRLNSVTVTVDAEDAGGNPTAGYTGTFTLSSSDGQFTPVTGLTLTNGVGTWTETLYTVGSQTFTATDNSASGNIGSATDTATPTTVTVGAASKVVFTTQPSSTALNTVMSPLVVVKVEDASGNPETGDNSSTVTLNPNGDAATGTSVTVVGGVATFSNLEFTQSGLGDTLTAVDGGLTPATSSPFNVTPVVTTTTESTSQASVVYGNTVTFTATVTAQGGTVRPTGTVTFFDATTNTSLGSVTASQSSGLASTWTLTTVAKTFNVTSGDAITATYSDTSFAGSSATVTETVTPRAITVTASTGNKTYDGTTTTSSTPSLTGGTLVSPDSLAYSESYAGKNVGNSVAMNINAGGSVNDGDGGKDYSVILNGNTGSITARAITVTAATATKVYDGTATTSATPTVTSSTQLASGDTLAYSESYGSKNAGSEALNINAGGSVNDGFGGNDYSVTTVGNTGSIQKLAITVTAVAAAKTYDGSTAAAGVPTLSTPLVGSDTWTTLDEAFANRNAGTGLTISPTAVINDGNGGANYSVTPVNNTAGLIAQRQITVTAAANSKVYDGGTAAATPASITGGSLAPYPNGSTYDAGAFVEVYLSRNAGANLTLLPSGSVNDGNSGQNYAVTFADSTSGSISPLAITVTASTANKTYDGTNSDGATPTGTALAPNRQPRQRREGLAGLYPELLPRRLARQERGRRRQPGAGRLGQRRQRRQ